MKESEVLEEVLGSSEIDLYGDSAEFYDLLYSAGMNNESKERSARRNLEEGDKVLDLACGTGIVTERLENDFDVTGADISIDMLEVANGKELDVEFVQADMTDLPFHEEFDVVLMYGQPLSHLENHGDIDLAAKSIYETLNPEGILVTDFFSQEAGKVEDMSPVEAKFGDYNVSMVPDFSDYNPATHTWEGSIEFSIQNGQVAKILKNSQYLRGYSLEEMKQVMREAGFNGVEEQQIFGGDLYHGIMAYKGEEPETSRELGFGL